MAPLTGSLRGRLSLAAAAVLAVGVALGLLGVYVTLSVATTSASDATLDAQAAAITAANGLNVGGTNVHAAVVGPDGSIIETPQQPLPARELRDLAQQVRESHGPVRTTLDGYGGGHLRVLAKFISGAQNVLVVNHSLSEVDQLVSVVMTALAGFSLLIVICGAFASYWLAGRILSPVHNLAETARFLGERDLHQRVEVDASDAELVELASTFNAMLARLESSFESLRRFTADASHELRAPLTLMRTEVDLALSRPRSGNKQALQAIQKEIEHLARITDQLLLLARADAGALQPAREPVDVADFVQEVGARWAATAAPRDIKVTIEVPDFGTVFADPGLLRRVMDNLLDNAVRHSPPGGTVDLRAQRHGGSWSFEVTDSGEGVAPDLRDRLFSRFAKGDVGEERGAGLGLALSAAIASVHRGMLRLKPGPGSTFELELPSGLYP